MITAIPGSAALGGQLKMQLSRHRSQQLLLGLKKPIPRQDFPIWTLTKPSLVRLSSALVCPVLSRTCRGAGAELCATGGSIGTCKGAPSQSRGAEVALEGQGQDIPPVTPWVAEA